MKASLVTRQDVAFLAELFLEKKEFS